MTRPDLQVVLLVEVRVASILVTGGTGSLGHALVRRCLADGWDRVVVYSRDEVKQAHMALDEGFGKHPAFRAFIGDVRDRDRLRKACRGIDVVVAAAALKRVDSTAYNPTELLKTNVLGVENTIEAAADAGVGKVVVISSDKACLPANPYGVSKAMAEALAVTSNTWAWPMGTKVAAVRYGNVLGSRGSVVHLWRAQAARGEPITVTDPEMTRFVMTVEQAAALVLWTVINMQGGEIVVPLLPSATVNVLAEAVAPVDHHARAVTGLRPGGEKRHEQLLTADEAMRGRVRWDGGGESYIIIEPERHDWSEAPWEGQRLPSDYTYRSDTNRAWRLSVEAVRDRLAQTEAMA